MGTVSDVDLAMNVSFDIVKNFWTLNFSKINERSWLSIFYGLASLGCIIVSSILVKHITYKDIEIGEMKDQIDHETKIGGLYKELRNSTLSRSISESFFRSFKSKVDKGQL
jgi:hypothetical protein